MITNWDKLVNRIKLETSQRLGRLGAHEARRGQALVAIKVSMLVDCEGVPVTWMIESSNIEPAGQAKTLLDAYLSMM